MARVCCDAERGPGASPASLRSRRAALAAAHLERRGLSVLECDAGAGNGPAELVATDGRTLVFARVMTAAAGARQAGEAARPLRESALDWLRSGGGRPPTGPVRLDLITVLLDERLRLVRLEHLEGAEPR